MGISWGLGFFDIGRRRIGEIISPLILLTSLRHVNRQGVDFRRNAFNLTLLASR
jgi:hypothetical protein